MKYVKNPQLHFFIACVSFSSLRSLHLPSPLTTPTPHCVPSFFWFMLSWKVFFSSHFFLLCRTCPLWDHSHPRFHLFPSLWAGSRIPTMRKWHQMLRHWLSSKWQFVCACVCGRRHELTFQPIWDLADSCYLFLHHKYTALTDTKLEFHNAIGRYPAFNGTSEWKKKVLQSKIHIRLMHK